MGLCATSLQVAINERELSKFPLRLWGVLYGTTAGLAYLHSKKYIHRDIKPVLLHFLDSQGNILLTEHWQPKVADFGLVTARSLRTREAKFGIAQESMTYGIGTPLYQAPDVIGSYDEKIDIYRFFFYHPPDCSVSVWFSLKFVSV